MKTIAGSPVPIREVIREAAPSRAGIAAGTVALLGIAAFATVEANKDADTKEPSPPQIAATTKLLEGTHSLMDSFTLKSGVRVRLNPQMINSHNTEPVHDSNVVFTVPSGKSLEVDNPIPFTDSATQTEWAAFERPGTQPQTTAERAKDMVYVNLTDISKFSPEDITFATDTASQQSVHFDNGNFVSNVDNALLANAAYSEFVPVEGR